MKRSDFYIRIITVVLFLAVASYIGVYIYNAAINTYVTAPAVNYSVEETISGSGYIIRAETVLTDSGAAILPIVSEGEKVASGQAIATEYLSRAALETASQLRVLRMRIAQLESSDDNAVESACIESVMKLSIAVQRGNLSSLDELKLKIETNIFAGGVSSEDELPELYARLTALESRIEGVRTIFAPASGIFSQVVDGFENIGPSELSDILPTRLDELFSAPSAVDSAGKLVTEFKWFFAAVMDADDAARISAGRQITVRFSGAYNEALEMKVENVGKREDGKCVVQFSCDRSVHQVAPLRYLRADVVTGAVTGIRVPKEAIQLDDDATTFVYLQTGARAERVNVEILHEADDAYLVRDGAETGSPLRAGSTIIVKANGLYNGKVVAK
jgi:multidrug efflux pump subunit AcrA (membrane-fusion protein)